MNIADVLSILHPDADFQKDIIIRAEGDVFTIDYWDVDTLGQQPTIEYLESQIEVLATEISNKQQQAKRKREYPTTDELIVALWESVVENDDTALNDLQAKRQLIKQKYPKA